MPAARGTGHRGAPNAAGFVVLPPYSSGRQTRGERGCRRPAASASSNKFRTPPTQPSVRQHQRSADEGKVDRGRQLNAAAVTEQPPQRNADEAAAPPSRNRRGAGKGAAAMFVGPGLKPPSGQRRGGAGTGCARREGAGHRGAPNAAGFVALPPDSSGRQTRGERGCRRPAASVSSKKIRTPPTQPSVRQHQRSADEGKVDRGRQLNAAAITEQPPQRNADEAAAPPSRNRRGTGKGAAAKFVRPGLTPPLGQRRGGAATGCARRRGTGRRGAPNAAGFVAPPPYSSGRQTIGGSAAAVDQRHQLRHFSFFCLIVLFCF